MEIITTHDIGVDTSIIDHRRQPVEADHGDRRNWNEYPEGPGPRGVPEIRERPQEEDRREGPPPSSELPPPPNMPIIPGTEIGYVDISDNPFLPDISEARATIDDVFQCGVWDEGGRVGSWTEDKKKPRRDKKPKPKTGSSGPKKKGNETVRTDWDQWGVPTGRVR